MNDRVDCSGISLIFVYLTQNPFPKNWPLGMIEEAALPSDKKLLKTVNFVLKDTEKHPNMLRVKERVSITSGDPKEATEIGLHVLKRPFLTILAWMLKLGKAICDLKGWYS